MHDWVLLSILFEWNSGQVKLEFRNSASEVVSLLASEVCQLHIPRMQEWGPSKSVNYISEPLPCENGNLKIGIEMQSGDYIEIIAKDFLIPK